MPQDETIELETASGDKVTVPLWPTVATIGRRIEGQAIQSCGDGTRIALFRQKEAEEDAKHAEVKPPTPAELPSTPKLGQGADAKPAQKRRIPPIVVLGGLLALASGKVRLPRMFR